MPKRVAINPGVLEALGRLGAFAGGLNSAIDAHDKLVKKRVIRPVIGGRKTVKRAAKRGRKNPVTHLDLPDDIVSRLGQEQIDAIFASEDPAGTLNALMVVAAQEDDYYALADYERLLAMMLAGGEIETEAREVAEVNPLVQSKTSERFPGWRLGDDVRSHAPIDNEPGKNPNGFIYSWQSGDKVRVYFNDNRLGDRSISLLEKLGRNPSYKVSVSVPSVNETVEVKGPLLSTGGALRRGKAKLRSAVKVSPKYSVERNPINMPPIDIPTEIVDVLGIDHIDWLLNKDNPRDFLAIGWNDALERNQIDVANAYSQLNNLLIQRDKVVRDLVESNPRKHKRIATAVLVNPSEQVLKLRRLFTQADNKLENARFYGSEKDVKKYQRVRERLLTNLRHTEKKERETQRNGQPEIAPATKSKLNKVSGMFHGPKNSHSGKVKNVEVSERVKARNFSRAGHGVALKLLNDATGKHAEPNHWCEECALLPNPETAFYGITTGLKVQPLGKGFLTVGKRLKNKLDRMTDEELHVEGVKRVGEEYDLGKADTSVYGCVEKWSDIEDPDLINYFHEWAEETKRTGDKPSVRLDRNGMPYFRGGKHTVTEAGIEN